MIPRVFSARANAVRAMPGENREEHLIQMSTILLERLTQYAVLHGANRISAH
jgi:hypothetical protein